MSLPVRLVAFGLFVLAAFDWPPPFLDRAGTAALAFGFLALSVGAASVGVRRARPNVPPRVVSVADEALPPVQGLAERLAAYDRQ